MGQRGESSFELQDLSRGCRSAWFFPFRNASGSQRRERLGWRVSGAEEVDDDDGDGAEEFDTGYTYL